MKKFIKTLLVATFAIVWLAILTPWSADALSYRRSPSDVYVRGYYRSNGTYVQPYYRSKPDGIKTNNYSYRWYTSSYRSYTSNYRSYTPSYRSYSYYRY